MLTLFSPAAVDIWFVDLIVAWAFVTGALYLVGAVALRQVDRSMTAGEALLVATGILTVLFGGLLLLSPDPLSETFGWIVSGYALVSGGLLMALALNIRTWQPLVSEQSIP